MNDELKRLMAALAVFAVIFWGSPYIMGSASYDETVRAIELLASVLGAGCCWIGSSKR